MTYLFFLSVHLMDLFVFIRLLYFCSWRPPFDLSLISEAVAYGGAGAATAGRARVSRRLATPHTLVLNNNQA